MKNNSYKIANFDEMTLSDWKSHLKLGNLHTREVFGRDPMFYACEFKNATLVKLLIKYGADVDIRFPGKNTPLIIAIARNEIHGASIAKVLIEEGADVNAVNQYKETPLHLCLTKKGVEILLEKGADMDLRNDDNKTPLESLLDYYYGLPNLKHQKIKDLFLKTRILREKAQITQNLPDNLIKNKKLRL